MTMGILADNNTSCDILISLGVSMKGIRPKGKCPVPGCGKSFRWDSGRGYVCPEHNTLPPRFLVDFNYKGERIRRGTTLDGKTLRTFGDASALLRQAQNEIDAKTFDPTKWKSKARLEFQFPRLMDKWLDERDDEYRQGRLSYSYVVQLQCYARKHYKPLFKDMDVRDIRATHIKDFIKDVRIAPSTQRTLATALRAFFTWLWKSEEAIKRVPHFPTIHVPQREATVITADVQAQILDLIPEKHRPIFAFLFNQGCRPSEARALKWKDIEGDVITFRRTWSKKVLKEHTKTGKVRRNYLFPNTPLPERRFGECFVFTHGGTDKHYCHKTLCSLFNTALGKLNEIRATQGLMEIKLTLYEATKHSFGTNRYREGTSLDVLQAHFGHSDRATTLIYTQLDPVDAFRRKVVELRSGDEKVTGNSSITP